MAYGGAHGAALTWDERWRYKEVLRKLEAKEAWKILKDLERSCKTPKASAWRCWEKWTANGQPTGLPLRIPTRQFASDHQQHQHQQVEVCFGLNLSKAFNRGVDWVYWVYFQHPSRLRICRFLGHPTVDQPTSGHCRNDRQDLDRCCHRSYANRVNPCLECHPGSSWIILVSATTVALMLHLWCKTW